MRYAAKCLQRYGKLILFRINLGNRNLKNALVDSAKCTLTNMVLFENEKKLGILT